MTLGGGDCGFYPKVGAEGVKDSVSKSQTGCALRVLTVPGNQHYNRNGPHVPIFSNPLMQPRTVGLPAQTVCARVF